MYKCRNCGCKYPDDFCSDDDIGICRWCSGEAYQEVDEEIAEEESDDSNNE